MNSASVDPSLSMRVRAVTAAGAGQVLEWFDYGVYGSLAPIIAKVFFPTESPTASILLTLAVFGVGFFSRPFGSVVFGYVADKYGRKVALSWTIFLMASATTLIGLIPSYAVLGVVAPILLTCCRLLQGLSAGGEWGSSTAFLVEYAGEKHRGFFGSFQQNLAVVGLALGALMGFALTNYLGTEALQSWGWRIPFLLGSVLGVVGWYIRTKVPDTPAFVKIEESDEVLANPMVASLTKTNLVKILQTMGLSTGWNAAFYMVISFMSTYTTTYLKLSLKLSLAAVLCSFVVLIVLIAVMGNLSDKIGRKPVLITGALGFVVTAYPVFAFMADGNFVKIVLGECVLAIFLSMWSGAGVAFLAELFTTEVRTSSMVGYNIMAALAGGMGPFFASYIIRATGNNLSPAFYVMCLMMVSFVTVLTIPESYNKPLK